MWIWTNQIRPSYPNSNPPVFYSPPTAVLPVYMSPHNPSTAPVTTLVTSTIPPPPPPICLLWVLHLEVALVPIMELRIIQDIKMKFFTPRSFIPHFPIKNIFLIIMQKSILTSKLVFLMGLILVHIQIVIKVIHTIHIGMKLCIETNMKITWQL